MVGKVSESLPKSAVSSRSRSGGFFLPTPRGVYRAEHGIACSLKLSTEFDKSAVIFHNDGERSPGGQTQLIATRCSNAPGLEGANMLNVCVFDLCRSV
ncbi:adenylosuccinate lyase [Anopheles sinensis]|uniref:Adenylosuccinate lyase n=1 Tax=Anopheles sinensis TaxID=74873 RepID=A0A084WFG8_ANOSI|nr:adenylosuccinate lyase [Anopheles sinensis]